MTDRSQPGYRGALPPQNDHLARPWVIVVILLFVAMFLLAFLGFPSRLFTEDVPQPGASPGGSIPIASFAPSGAASGAPQPSP